VSIAAVVLVDLVWSQQQCMTAAARPLLVHCFVERFPRITFLFCIIAT